MDQYPDRKLSLYLGDHIHPAWCESFANAFLHCYVSLLKSCMYFLIINRFGTTALNESTKSHNLNKLENTELVKFSRKGLPASTQILQPRDPLPASHYTWQEPQASRDQRGLQATGSSLPCLWEACYEEKSLSFLSPLSPFRTDSCFLGTVGTLGGGLCKGIGGATIVAGQAFSAKGQIINVFSSGFRQLWFLGCNRLCLWSTTKQHS